MKTVVSLDKSIEKWENIVSGNGMDFGADNCELCHKFGKVGCFNCPVKEKTGFGSCYETPFAKWRNHHKEVHSNMFSRKVECKVCLRLAKEELAFLKGLRKKVKE